MMMMMMIDDEAGVPSCRRQHVERPSVPRHTCTVTRALHTASQDFPLLSFLPGHPYMTYLSLLIIINVKKLLFRHELTANDTSKTAKITKR